MKITYCHVSPEYIVETGQEVLQGQVIGFVGPKNVYGVVRKPIQRQQPGTQQMEQQQEHIYI